MSTSSNIRVSVQWKQSTVFAGEDVECTITFKNIAPVAGRERSPVRGSHPNGLSPGEERQRKLKPLHPPARPSVSRNSSFGSPVPQHAGKGHKPTLSLSGPSIPARGTSPGPSSGRKSPGLATQRSAHGRSLSIISIGSESSGYNGQGQNAAGAGARSTHGHTRSTSMQITSRRPSDGLLSGGYRSTAQPSPLGLSSPADSEAQGDVSLSVRPARRPSGQGRTPNTPSHAKRMSISQGFRLPAASSGNRSPSPEINIDVAAPTNPMPRTPHLRTHVPRPPEEPPPALPETLSPITRILSDPSMNGTPRSSTEIYSMTNNSSETLASEYMPQASNRLLSGSNHVRSSSRLAMSSQRIASEILMMGYAQIMGSFTVDGSLVNQAPFEEVKRKGVVGGHGGGGVVGVERTKRESGLFGALGWGSIGESLGGLLGGGEPSSIREMRGIANSKTIPLLSTPQSILFVNLQLAPGESRSYQYSFTLPRGLPPSHRGRAMKVSYHLTIGTQRPGSAKDQQQFKAVGVPFRVLGSVNAQGEILGHDLMSPYIILRDEARTRSLSPSSPSFLKKPAKPANAGLSDFLTYVDALLTHSQQSPTAVLLSPSDAKPRRASSISIPEPQSAKEAIDLAILRSNATAPSSTHRTNRFAIARGGRRVAVLTLLRPALRLGETVPLTLDFAGAQIPTYGVRLWLESAETVDPAIALRSPASVYRATRKVHAAVAGSALWARRLAFGVQVPLQATPEFVTSGVGCEWRVGVEFVTPRLVGEEGGVETREWEGLLEEVGRDERGVVLAAVERLECEAFEVKVPVRVYGAVAGVGESADVEGLVV